MNLQFGFLAQGLGLWTRGKTGSRVIRPIQIRLWSCGLFFAVPISGFSARDEFRGQIVMDSQIFRTSSPKSPNY